ncbi:MAG: phosphoribosylamine--glycine ligase [Fastidiosipilaceae bacterium]
MKILVIGGGGREAAIIWKLSQSPHQPELYCAPGNYGIGKLATCVPLSATDLDGIVNFAQDESLDLVVVAPDDPLALGLVDRLTDAGVRAFGPTAAAAEIEASKIFSKQLMREHGIPTAGAEVFTVEQDALDWLSRQTTFPVVVKADGLALGKGVLICADRAEAERAVREMMSGNQFGDAGSRVLIEECLTGPELTVLAFTDGKTIAAMPSSRDHKRALDHDLGLNTGGMGAVVPGADLDAEQWARLRETIFQPTIDALSSMGRVFKGVIYFGLMLTADGPKVIEYNARFGDPEAQAVLPLLRTDLLDVINAVIDERLADIEIKWSDEASCCVVAASAGYPAEYEKGKKITGLEDCEAMVFHAGTTWSAELNSVVTNGGRVLGVCATGATLDEALDEAYDNLGRIHFDGMHYRKDIGRTIPQ